MKKNRANYFISRSLETLVLAIIIGWLTVMAAKGEEVKRTIDPSVLNGLFSPTQAERFFQTGTENWEREIEIFTHPERYWRSDLLQIDPELKNRLDQNQELPNSQFHDFDGQIYFRRLRIIDF